MATQHEHWTRVRDRLRAEVGDNVYSSWFARMDLEGIEGETVKLSVPTRFLKSWIASHYTEKVMACWQAEQPGISRVEITVRSAVLRPVAVKAAPVELPAPARDTSHRSNGVEVRIGGGADLGGARGARRLAARPAADLRQLHRRPLQHAGARRRQAGRAGAPRRQRDVQSALHPCRRRARQDASAAVAGLGRQRERRTQGALPDGRAVHVRLRRRAAGADRDRLQGGAARPSTCW